MIFFCWLSHSISAVVGMLEINLKVNKRQCVKDSNNKYKVSVLFAMAPAHVNWKLDDVYSLSNISKSSNYFNFLSAYAENKKYR